MMMMMMMIDGCLFVRFEMLLNLETTAQGGQNLIFVLALDALY